MKRSLSFILALLTALSCFSALLFTPAAAEETEPSEETNVALGKEVYGGGSGLDAVTDGITDTNLFWDGGSAPAYALIDLEGFYKISRVNVITYYGDQRSYKYKIEGSDDGIAFTVLAEKKDNDPATAKGHDFEIDATMRYLRVTLTYNSANAAVHLVEVSAYGVPDDDYVPPEKPTTDEKDPDNVAYGKPTRSNSASGILGAVNDGNEASYWEGEDYPRYVDIDLMDNYELSSLKFYFRGTTMQSVIVYGSLDGVNFTRLYRSKGYISSTTSGKKLDFEEGTVYRILRFSLTGSGEGGGKRPNLAEVRVYGKKSESEVTPTREKMVFTSYEDWLKENCGVDVPALKDENGKYKIADTFTFDDTEKELNGIVSRMLGEDYISWFEFAVAPGTDPEKDYFRIEDSDNGKVKITGSDGVCVAAGLNWYLKYFCNVHIAQQTKQTKMPDAVVKVGEPVYKDTNLKLRYAYNYCTLSYTMAFFGYDDWRRELDWLYLNGINLILDTTATEAMWVEYLQRLGYGADDAKNYVCGYAYKAWWLMGNLEGYGGSVSDMWIYDTLNLARVNQRSMTVMGARPALQTFVGAMPQSFKRIANAHLKEKGYPDVSPYMAAQGSWAGALTRPNVLRTDYEGYSYLAQLFYETQEYIYGQVTDWFCGDVCHEGGIIPAGLKKEEMSEKILSELMAYDSCGVWILQRWWDNPLREVLDGFGEYRTTNILVLDLNTAQTTANFTDRSKYGDTEFGGTAWIASTLDNYGGNPGMHGNLKRMCENIIRAKTTCTHIKGLGMTPEGTQNNPVMMDLYWELVWRDETPDLPEWIDLYAQRRYGEKNDSAHSAWKKLYNTVYTQGNADDGATVRFSTNTSPKYDIGGGYYEPKYRPAQLFDAVEQLAKCFDRFKDNECYIYDLTDTLCTYLDAVAVAMLKEDQKLMKNMKTENAEAVLALTEKYLDVILLLDEVCTYSKDMMVGTWIGRAYGFMDDERTLSYDDYSEDMMVFNAKALITAWHSATLIDYANRCYNGVMADYYYKSWETMLTPVIRRVMRGSKPDTSGLSGAVHFQNAWKFAISDKVYRTAVASPDGDDTGRGLRAILDYVTANYQITNMKNRLTSIKPSDDTLTLSEGVLTGLKYGAAAKEAAEKLTVPEGCVLRIVDGAGNELKEDDAITGRVTVELMKEGVRVNALTLAPGQNPAEKLPFGVGELIASAALLSQDL